MDKVSTNQVAYCEIITAQGPLGSFTWIYEGKKTFCKTWKNDDNMIKASELAEQLNKSIKQGCWKIVGISKDGEKIINIEPTDIFK